MASRGRKPTVPYLREVTGNPQHRPLTQDAAESVDPTHDNGLEPPRKLTKRQQELWDSYIRRAPWLKSFDVPRAYMWVSLHSEFERSPSKMIAGKIAQLRALGSELGLDPASRARLGAGNDSDKNKSPASKYFD